MKPATQLDLLRGVSRTLQSRPVAVLGAALVGVGAALRGRKSTASCSGTSAMKAMPTWEGLATEARETDAGREVLKHWANKAEGLVPHTDAKVRYFGTERALGAFRTDGVSVVVKTSDTPRTMVHGPVLSALRYVGPVQALGEPLRGAHRIRHPGLCGPLPGSTPTLLKACLEVEQDPQLVLLAAWTTPRPRTPWIDTDFAEGMSGGGTGSAASAAGSMDYSTTKDSYIPLFSGQPSDYKEWRKRLTIYVLKMRMAKREAEGLLNVIGSLTGTAWKLLENYPIEEIEKTGAFDKILKILDKAFEYDSTVQLPSDFDKYAFNCIFMLRGLGELSEVSPEFAIRPFGVALQALSRPLVNLFAEWPAPDFWKLLENYPIEEIEKTGAFDKILKILDKAFEYDSTVQLPSDFDKYFSGLQRRPGQTLLDYTTEHDHLYNKLGDHGVTLPSKVQGWHLLRRAGLTREQRQLITTQAPSMERNKIQEALFLILGQDHKSVAGGGQHPYHRGIRGKGRGYAAFYEGEDNENYDHNDYWPDDDELQEEAGYYEGEDNSPAWKMWTPLSRHKSMTLPMPPTWMPAAASMRSS
eukprot:s52_g42.t1